MGRCVALLGSINVGGNRLQMTDLKQAFETTGFKNVETIIASGNVVFDGNGKTESDLEQQISLLVKETFNINSLVVVRSKTDLENVIASSPFLQESESKFVHIHFLENEVQKDAFEKLLIDYQGLGNEKIVKASRALHIYYVDGVGRSKLTASFIERRLGCKGTARNLSSLRRIIGKMV
jgi:uncharacterized protein (DUF1697 family)